VIGIQRCGELGYAACVVDGITVEDGLAALREPALVATAEVEKNSDGGKGSNEGDHDTSDGRGV